MPFSLKEKVEAEIHRFINNQILVPTEYSEWGTPIVAVLKPNVNVLICGNYKVTVNLVLEDFKYPLLRIEYLFSKSKDGVLFTKIDLSEGYLQIGVDEKSQNILTISTHKGLFSYTRLLYGIKSAQAIFQRIMENLFANVPNVVCFLDDILVTGKNNFEHLNTLSLVFKKLYDCRLRVKKEKCSFLKEYVNGLHKSDERIRAIVKARPPKNLK